MLVLGLASLALALAGPGHLSADRLLRLPVSIPGRTRRAGPVAS